MRSIEASLVGTMEYIAPELITSEKYSCSVDYWSLGVIGYEIIAGTRPFVPHLPLAQWMLRVRDKKSEHIAITECDSGNFFYSNKIAAESHITASLSHLLVDWLRLALEWNPKQRGNTFEFAKPKSVSFTDADEPERDSPQVPIQAPVKTLKFFNTLDDVLSRKILSLFVIDTQRRLSIEITDATTMDELYAFVQRETNIPKEKCHLIIPLENLSADIRKLKRAADLYFDGHYDKPMVYVHELISLDEMSAKGGVKESTVAVELPESVRGVLTNHEQKMKVHTLRKFANDTLYFVRLENEKYKLSLDGCFNYALQLNHEVEICRKDVTELNALIHGLNGAAELYERTLLDTKQRMDQVNLSSSRETPNNSLNVPFFSPRRCPPEAISSKPNSTNSPNSSSTSTCWSTPARRSSSATNPSSADLGTCTRTRSSRKGIRKTFSTSSTRRKRLTRSARRSSARSWSRSRTSSSSSARTSA